MKREFTAHEVTCHLIKKHLYSTQGELKIMRWILYPYVLILVLAMKCEANRALKYSTVQELTQHTRWYD